MLSGARGLSVRYGVYPKVLHRAVLRPRCTVRRLTVLAIETSCDDTGVAVLSTTSPPTRATLHFNEKITSVNKADRGIHPLVAARGHQANLAKLIARAIPTIPRSPAQHGQSASKPDFVAVTRGPGMRTSLLTGLDTAKGLAVAWDVPLVGVHHMLAHALTSRLDGALKKDDDDGVSDAVSPAFPFLTLLVSGGHTMLVHSRSLVDHSVVVNTLDIAIGDVLDKLGRMILPVEVQESMPDTAYAKYLSQYAFESDDAVETYPVPERRNDEIRKTVNEFGWSVSQPLVWNRDLAFSFSGLASQFERLWQTRQTETQDRLSDAERLVFAQHAFGIACEHLASRVIIAFESLQKNGEVLPQSLVVSGGVAASAFLRRYLRRFLDIRGFSHMQLLFPPAALCTDNAAMIAWAGIELFEAGFRSDLSCSALNKWSMDPRAEDGGISGVDGWAMNPRSEIVV